MSEESVIPMTADKGVLKIKFLKIPPHKVTVMFVLMVDEVDRDGNETITLLTKHKGPKARVKDNETF